MDRVAKHATMSSMQTPGRKPYQDEHGRYFRTHAEMVAANPKWASAEIERLRRHVVILERALCDSWPGRAMHHWLLDLQSAAQRESD